MEFDDDSRYVDPSEYAERCYDADAELFGTTEEV